MHRGEAAGKERDLDPGCRVRLGSKSLTPKTACPIGKQKGQKPAILSGKKHVCPLVLTHTHSFGMQPGRFCDLREPRKRTRQRQPGESSKWRHHVSWCVVKMCLQWTSLAQIEPVAHAESAPSSCVSMSGKSNQRVYTPVCCSSSPFVSDFLPQ